jgi:hypothetical protein
MFSQPDLVSKFEGSYADFGPEENSQSILGVRQQSESRLGLVR